MALPADAVIMERGIFSARNVMWIVACGASEFAAAPQEALGFAQPINRVHYFKIIVVLTSSSVIEKDHEITQRFARPIGKWLTAVPADGMRKVQAGCFKVALHTHFHLPLGS